jgi:hypothetical protein
MIVAAMVAGIGVMLDQPILIVGVMVVGPEFGSLPWCRSAASPSR